MSNDTQDFYYLAFETMLGGHPQYPNTLMLRVKQEDLQGFIYKAVRAIRDHAPHEQVTIPLSGCLVSAADAKPTYIGE